MISTPIDRMPTGYSIRYSGDLQDGDLLWKDATKMWMVAHPALVGVPIGTPLHPFVARRGEA